MAYADNVVVLAEDKANMVYLDGKGLVLNGEKSKVMRFRKRGREGAESEV